MDWLGATAIIAALAGVTGFVESPNLGWPHPVVISSLIGGFAFLSAFVLIEMRVSSPMVPLALFRSQSFRGANLLTFFLYAAMGTFFFVFPMSLIQIHGFSSTQAATAALPMVLLMSSLSRWSGGLVDRYGPRIPLVSGPLIAAAGFIIFASASVGESYWKALFPAFLVLGLGMAITVAPLTTVVMSSVDQDRAGTASGINNAVARVAGVLAIAVFGVVLVASFSSHLNQSLSKIPLSPEKLQQIKSSETRLAALKVPDGVDAGTATALKSAIAGAFVAGLRLVVLICAGLAAASSALAWRMIPARNSPRSVPSR